MALCNKCLIWDAEYDAFVGNYDDIEEIGQDQREKKHCRMYSDYIPLKITYNEGDCQFFVPNVSRRGE